MKRASSEKIREKVRGWVKNNGIVARMEGVVAEGRGSLPLTDGGFILRASPRQPDESAYDSEHVLAPGHSFVSLPE